MKCNRFTEKKIWDIEEAEAGGALSIYAVKMASLMRHFIHGAETLGRMNIPDVKGLLLLDQETARLERIADEQALDTPVLKDVFSKILKYAAS